MARYDVFLVNALADREKAELIVRRLRALKFKVRYDKKREHTTPSPKDYRDADNSQSIMVIWSKDACDTDKRDSDWVHAIAHHARSKDGALLQVGLDKTVPDDPFADDKRFSLTGMGPRKLVAGYYDLVTELGRRDGRKDLRAWIDLKASDKDGKASWLKNHPTDPLAVAAKPKAATATKASARPVAAAPAVPPRATPKPLSPPTTAPQTDEDTLGRIMLAIVVAVILGMLVMSAAIRSGPQELAIAGYGDALVAQCPPGQMPDYLLEEQVRPPLEPGPIIDDTDE